MDVSSPKSQLLNGLHQGGAATGALPPTSGEPRRTDHRCAFLSSSTLKQSLRAKEVVPRLDAAAREHFDTDRLTTPVDEDLYVLDDARRVCPDSSSNSYDPSRSV